MIPRYLDIALKELGVTEVTGPYHNPRILEYHDTTTLGDWGRSRDETPWCSSFVNWCVTKSGLEGTNNALARSWLKWGVEADSSTGAVCIIRSERARQRARVGSRGGYHVGIVLGSDGRRVLMVSGNARNRVGIDSYSKRRWRVMGYRVPG